jgi:hypothetical protein
MQQLEEKLATLSDGTEAVAAVMANWGSVLRAVSMASGKWMVVREVVLVWAVDWFLGLAGIPKPKEDGSGEGEDEAQQQLPNTLVRIPIHQAEAAQREQEKEAAAGAGWRTCCRMVGNYEMHLGRVHEYGRAEGLCSTTAASDDRLNLAESCAFTGIAAAIQKTMEARGYEETLDEQRRKGRLGARRERNEKYLIGSSEGQLGVRW